MKHFQYKEGMLHCEGVKASQLAQDFGSPLYVYSKAALVDAYKEVKSAFSEVPTTLCFSVKSCGSLAVLKTLREAGSGFDIVSGGELFRALKVGADPRKIVYAGVGKTDVEIKAALEQDILMFNVESEAELDVIQEIAAGMGKVAPVAFRINPDVDANTHAKTTTGKKENKFGIDLANASRLVNNIAEQPNIRLLGVDMHLGSPVYDVAPYKLAMEKISEFVRSHRSPRAPLEYINAGGGYGLLYRDQKVPSFRDYAEVITPYVKATGCRLIIEPGRSIVGNAAVLLTRVVFTKDNGHKHFTIVDAGMNDLVRPAMYDSYHFAWPTAYPDVPPADLFGSDNAENYFFREDEEGKTGHWLRNIDEAGFIRTDIVGPICESSDCFAKGRRIPVMHRGDLLAIFSAGAYGFSMASNYNARPLPAEVMVDGGTAHLIRKRQSYEDLVSGELFE